jgi:hypothetical protein
MVGEVGFGMFSTKYFGRVGREFNISLNHVSGNENFGRVIVCDKFFFTMGGYDGGGVGAVPYGKIVVVVS